jgi:hypothetical protein
MCKEQEFIFHVNELNITQPHERNNEVAEPCERIRPGARSDKYKGFFSKEEGQQLNDHIQQMRSEWNGYLIDTNVVSERILMA